MLDAHGMSVVGSRSSTSRRRSVGNERRNSLDSIKRSSLKSTVTSNDGDMMHEGTSLSARPDSGLMANDLSRRQRGSALCARILNNYAYIGLMSTLTIFVLVGDDIRLGFFSPASDPTFNWIAIASLILFSLEITLSSIAKADYMFSFWFIADVFASVSLILDLTFVSEALLGDVSISAETVKNAAGSTMEETEYARASRSGRVGTRIARILRVLRLVRLTRVLQCFHRIKSDGASNLASPGQAAELGKAGEQESHVGKKLSERTTQRVIILVLVMLLAVPYLDGEDPEAMLPISAEYGSDWILHLWQEYEQQVHANRTTSEQLEEYRVNWEKAMFTYVYYHAYGGIKTCPSTVRCADTAFLWRLCWVGYVKNSAGNAVDTLDVMDEAYLKVLFNSKANDDVDLALQADVPQDVRDALASPWRADCSEAGTLIRGFSFIDGIACPKLSYRKQETRFFLPQVNRKGVFDRHMEAQFVFIFDIREEIKWGSIFGIMQTGFVIVVLVVGALFFSKDVDKLVLHPIERMIEQVEYIRRDPIYAVKLSEEQQAAIEGAKGRSTKRADRAMETIVLENTIIKLGSLLALCYGEAGAETIGENLDANDSTVDALIPGFRVEAIYGICTMHEFATVTEVLQQNMMIFVNQVSEIVHRTVDRHMGAVNGQRGTSATYLVVWRIENYVPKLQTKIADLAVMSFVQVGVEVGRDWELQTQWEHPGIKARIKSSSIRLGFGLHSGWAIEGAIGSEVKIDVSYVSPHVNLAGQLAAKTGHYGVSMLLSEPIVKSTSSGMREYVRPVDHVRMEGARSPIRLYTVDLDYSVIGKQSKIESRWRASLTKERKKREHERLKADNLSEGKQVHKLFVADKNLVKMRRCYTTTFYQEFAKGYLNYEAGEWALAANVFKSTMSMLRGGALEDGPSRTLLEFIDSFGCEAPTGWRGFHDLSSTLSHDRALESTEEQEIPLEPKLPRSGLLAPRASSSGTPILL